MEASDFSMNSCSFAEFNTGLFWALEWRFVQEAFESICQSSQSLHNNDSSCMPGGLPATLSFVELIMSYTR